MSSVRRHTFAITWIKELNVKEFLDGPAHSAFETIALVPNQPSIKPDSDDDCFVASIASAPTGEQVAWGIPFRIDRSILVSDRAVSSTFQAVAAEWLVFRPD